MTPEKKTNGKRVGSWVIAVFVTLGSITLQQGFAQAKNPTACTLATLNGMYAFDATGYNIVNGSPVPKAVAEFLNFKGDGTLTSLATLSVNGNIVQNDAAPSVLLKIASILREDYLIPDVEPVLADISHNVQVYPVKAGDQLTIYIARSSPLLPPLLEFYDRAYDLFTQFMKDFVRVHVYSRITQFVPSSTRDGVEALRKILERNRELYRYEETEMGDFEGILGEYLAGSMSFSQVLQQAHSRARPQTQTVAQHQVGSVENEVPGVVDSPVTQVVEEGMEFSPAPPIIRDSVSSDMKILTTSQKYPQLNGFTMLLGLSDRLVRTEAAITA